MATHSALFLLSLLSPVVALKISQTDAPKTKMNGVIVEGPWNAIEHQCKPDKHIEIFTNGGAGQFELKFCKEGWELLQSQHKGKQCVVYDLGVREEAALALEMIENWGCQVRAYDPSETTAKWWDRNGTDVLKLKEHEQKGQYKLWKQAAGGSDGELKLYAYNWNQVGAFQASEKTKGEQKEYIVPSKTLESMMKENGDSSVDILKIDIEGSEFAFLNQAFDKGCPAVEHMLLEWHSQDLDLEYGAPPNVKEVESKMFKCGFKKYGIYPFFVTKDPTEDEKFDIAATYYGHAAYCKNCVA